MRGLTDEVKAMHDLYDVQDGDSTYAAAADAVIENFQVRFKTPAKRRVLDMAAGYGEVANTLAQRNSELPEPFKLELIKADVVPDELRGVVGVDESNWPVVDGKRVEEQFDAAVSRGACYSPAVTHGMVVAMVALLNEGGFFLMVIQINMLHCVAPTLCAATAAGVLTDVTIDPAAQQEGRNPAYLRIMATRGHQPVEHILDREGLLRRLCLGGCNGTPTPLGEACLEALSMTKRKLELDATIRDIERPFHASLNFGICVAAAGMVVLQGHQPFGRILASVESIASLTGASPIVLLLEKFLNEADTSGDAVVQLVNERKGAYEEALSNLDATAATLLPRSRRASCRSRS
jgi:hypothetical protein